MAVLLFTDIVESVALEQRLGTESYSRMLRVHHQLFRKTLDTLGTGKVHLDTGDGFLAEFNTAAAAVNAALLFRTFLDQEQWEFGAPKVRAGIHQGQLAEIRLDQESPGKIVGMPVNIANRVMSLAQGGQVLMTRAVYDDARQFVREHPARLIPGVSPPPLHWKSHGAYQFKGADQPTEVFEVGVSGMPALLTFGNASETARGNMNRLGYLLVLGLWTVVGGLRTSRAAPVLAAAQETEWRKQICTNFFVPDPLPALAAQTHRRFSAAPGVKAEAVTYATEFGGRVPAILYLPDPLPKGGKIPAFIVVNGHGGDKYCWYSWYTGILFARGGAAVLTYDMAGEGERNREHKVGTRAHDNIKGDAVLARRLAGLMLTDVRQAVSYLCERPEVDKQRIAAGGYSLGSFVLALAGAVETRLHACVLVGGGNLDGPEGRWDSSGKKMCESMPYRSLNFLGDRPAVIYALQAARGPALIFNGLGDSVVGIPKHGEAFFQDLRKRTAQLRGSEAGIFETGFAPTNASHRPYFVTRPVVQWLERQLDFPNWTISAIQAMPETRISVWAEQHSVPMDKLYATEEREGGTMALGNDIPGYTREMLDVFPREEWEARKKDFILESWLEAARR